MADANDDNNLLDYEEEETPPQPTTSSTSKIKAGSHVGLHSAGFKDFVLTPDLQRAVVDAGFEHPSQVQSECVPQAMLGEDIICQAKSGMGKTAVFVLATLHQLAEAGSGAENLGLKCVVLCHTRELAFQISKEYKRFSKYLNFIESQVILGGTPIGEQAKWLKETKDKVMIAVGTPGRLLDLLRRGHLDLSKIKHFVIDECDQVLESLDMRKDVSNIFFKTPHTKQVMMFSATMNAEIRPVVKKFCNNALELYVDDETKLTLHGLQQYYANLKENQKNRKLNDLLDDLDFNQVIIFVATVRRAKELNKLLQECNFPSLCVTSQMRQADRIAILEKFKKFEARILVSTDLLGRGIDIERVNVVINYDFPESADGYLHRVNRAGRFGTKGLAISFVSEEKEKDAQILKQVQERFEAKIETLPESIDASTYMNA